MDRVQVFTFQTKQGPNFFINIHNSHLKGIDHDHVRGRRHLSESEINSEGLGKPNYTCKSAWREKKVTLYLAESQCIPGQHSTDQQHTEGQTRFAKNTTYRIRDSYNRAHKKVIAVSVSMTSFTVGFYHIFFSGRKMKHEWHTDNNRYEYNGKLNFLPKLSTLKKNFDLRL